MAFREFWFALFLSLALISLSEARAADCVVSRYPGDLTSEVLVAQDAETKALCGSLQAIYKRRDDPRPNVIVTASYAEFRAPSNAAERLYNDWISKLVAQVPLQGPLDGPAGAGPDMIEYSLSAGLYLSPNLLSATFGERICCGAHEYRRSGSLNIDVETGRVVVPGDLVRLGAVGNFCWQQFSKYGSERGALFVEHYPLVRPFSDEDFIARSSVSNSADAILYGMRTFRLFGVVLRDSQFWSFHDRGLVINFGEPLGYSEAEFVCEIGLDDLKRMAKPGVSMPP